MGIKSKYSVRGVQKWECKEWLLSKHYAGRVPSISYAFVLYAGASLVGVMTIGKPASPFLCVGVCGPNYSELVYELNRMCVNEGLERNTLSFFVGKALKLLVDDLILVSYADTAHGHHGYIYQATNWVYTGKTKPTKDRMLIGATTHARHNNVYEVAGEWEEVERSIKHRYVYFLGAKRKEFARELRYDIQPYPKGENRRYDASYEPVTQELLFF